MELHAYEQMSDPRAVNSCRKCGRTREWHLKQINPKPILPDVKVDPRTGHRYAA